MPAVAAASRAASALLLVALALCAAGVLVRHAAAASPDSDQTMDPVDILSGGGPAAAAVGLGLRTSPGRCDI